MDNSIRTKKSSAEHEHWTTDHVRNCVEDSEIVVFAKGTRERPRCGFSEQVFSAVDSMGRPYKVIDVCQDPSIMPALRAYEGQQILPLVYVKGRLVGNSLDFSRKATAAALTKRLQRAIQ